MHDVTVIATHASLRASGEQQQPTNQNGEDCASIFHVWIIFLALPAAGEDDWGNIAHQRNEDIRRY